MGGGYRIGITVTLFLYRENVPYEIGYRDRWRYTRDKELIVNIYWWSWHAVGPDKD